LQTYSGSNYHGIGIQSPKTSRGPEEVFVGIIRGCTGDECNNWPWYLIDHEVIETPHQHFLPIRERLGFGFDDLNLQTQLEYSLLLLFVRQRNVRCGAADLDFD
jgi:hypothetical protein